MNVETVAWTSWNPNGTPRASKTHILAECGTRTLCGQRLPEPAACSADECGGRCRACEKRSRAGSR